jgi:hypothetical protein
MEYKDQKDGFINNSTYVDSEARAKKWQMNLR